MSEHASLATANWLGLAAAPAFAAMASLTAFLDDGRMAAICSSSQAPAWFGGMVPMYLLMSAFHLAPWLRRFHARPARPGNRLPSR